MTVCSVDLGQRYDAWEWAGVYHPTALVFSETLLSSEGFHAPSASEIFQGFSAKPSRLKAGGAVGRATDRIEDFEICDILAMG